ncbi:MAG: hypothetical protein GX654_13095 [Desulfatiglans sp.]|nr:hypothetical protein [Desulfatiglans sp.]
MIKIKIVICFITMFILCANAYAENPSVKEILNKVAATYESMKTYKCKGTRSSFEKSTMGTGSGGESTFTILLKKPNMYLMTWTVLNLPSGHNIKVLWSDGSQPYLYGGYSLYKITTDDIALRKGLQVGAPVHLIPLHFLSNLKHFNIPSLELINPRVEKVEKIGEDDCYMISGSSAESKIVNIWISKTSYHIIKYMRSTEPPEGGRRWPGITDEQIEKEKYYLEEYKRRKTSGFYTEVYTEISSPELSKEDFKYTVPKGTEIREIWPDD